VNRRNVVGFIMITLSPHAQGGFAGAAACRDDPGDAGKVRRSV
jgi:hypothetical protein